MGVQCAVGETAKNNTTFCAQYRFTNLNTRVCLLIVRVAGSTIRKCSVINAVEIGQYVLSEIA